MKTKIRIYLLFFSMICMVSCIMNTSSDKFPGIGVPLAEMNTKISIKMVDNLNSYKIGQDINFELINLTNNPIQVTPDNDIYLYEKSQSTYMKIDNILQYSSAIEQVPTKQEDIFGTGSLLFTTRPNIHETDKSINIRIFVIGTICNNDGTPTNKRVGAYIDVVLNP